MLQPYPLVTVLLTHHFLPYHRTDFLGAHEYCTYLQYHLQYTIPSPHNYRTRISSVEDSVDDGLHHGVVDHAGFRLHEELIGAHAKIERLLVTENQLRIRDS